MVIVERGCSGGEDAEAGAVVEERVGVREERGCGLGVGDAEG